MDYSILRQHSEGLICLSGCASGRLSKALQNGQIAQAEAEVDRLADIFGRENVYLEIQETGIRDLAEINPRMIELAGKTGLKLVATNDVHYLRENDATAHDVLLCIQTGSRLSEENRMRFTSEAFYLKSEEEMLEAFPDHPEALATTLEIAERCNVEIKLDEMLIPHFPVPEGYDEATYDEKSYLREQCEKGLVRRFGDQVTPAIRERLENELVVVEKMGFPAYFLIVWDFVSYAKRNGIPVGPGRGSAAGSLVSYLLGITDLDPIKYDLLFERFLNPDRISMPDIDIDFSVVGREKVIEYVANKYGRDRVAQIATFGTIKARQAIRDAARVMDVPYGQADRIAKLVPEVLNITLDACLADPKCELKIAYDAEPQVREVVDMARPLEGLIRQDSIHAAGVVISKGSLTDHLPLMQKGDAEVVTQVSMNDVEKLGLLKMDFLGLRNLDVIDQAVKIIRAEGYPDFDIETIPLDDADDLPDAGQGRFHRGVPVRVERHARGYARHPADPVRRSHRPRGALPSGAHGVHPRVRAQQAQSRGDQVRGSPLGADPRPHVRRGHLPRAAHGDLQAHRRIHSRPGRRPAQGHRQEDPGQDGPARAQVPGGRRGYGHGPEGHRLPVVAHGEGRRLLVQQVARRLLRAHRLPHGVPEGQPSGAVHGGSHLERHGHQGQGALLRQRGQRHGHRGAAARHQRVGARLPRHRGAHPLRTQRREERRRDGHPQHPRRAEAGRPVHRPVRLLRAGRHGGRQRQGDRESHQVGQHGFHRPVAPGHAPRHAAGHVARQEDPLRRRSGPGLDLRPHDGAGRRGRRRRGRQRQRPQGQRSPAGGDADARTSARKSCCSSRRRRWASMSARIR